MKRTMLLRHSWFLLFCFPVMVQPSSMTGGGTEKRGYSPYFTPIPATTTNNKGISSSSSSSSRDYSSISSNSNSNGKMVSGFKNDEQFPSSYNKTAETSSHLQFKHVASPALTVLGERILSKQFLNVALTGIQFGLCFYIARALWKAIVEVVEEFESENQSMGGGSSLVDDHEMPLLSDEGVRMATESLSESSSQSLDDRSKKDHPSGEGISGSVVNDEKQGQGSRVNSNSSSSGSPSTTTTGKKKKINRYQSSFASSLALRLFQSGLPPVSPPSPEGLPPIKSVQSVLKVLTRTEGRLLSSTLLSPYEGDAMTDVNARNQKITSMWEEIGGLDDVKEGLMDLVFPLMGDSHVRAAASLSGGRPPSQKGSGSYYGGLLDNPPGVLLYGPPGCGKTMLVRALAKTANARFLCVSPSTLFRKYVGETNINVKALFTLARKISPCIIFIDEMEGLFRERRSSGSEEHEVNRELKTEFMQLWDGIQDENGGIVVIGATNRPFDVDSAFLRRMPRSFFVGLPNANARRNILKSLLSNVPLDRAFDWDQIVQATEGYTPSDMKEVLRTAALFPLREARADILRRRQAGQELLTPRDYLTPELRPLQTHDVMQALARVSPTPLSNDYTSALVDFAAKATGRRNMRSSQGMSHMSHDHNRLNFQGSNDYFVANIEQTASPSMEGFDSYKEKGFDDNAESYDESYDDDDDDSY